MNEMAAMNQMKGFLAAEVRLQVKRKEARVPIKARIMVISRAKRAWTWVLVHAVPL